MGDLSSRMPFWLRLPLTLLPPSCRHCGAMLDVVRRAGGPASRGLPYLCGECWNGLPWLAEGPLHPPEGLRQIWGACRYAPPVNDWIQSLKYGRQEPYAPMLGALLRQAGKDSRDQGTSPSDNEPWPMRFDAVAPVPLHPSRLRMRGFNQSLLLAHLWLKGLRGGSRPKLAGGLLRRIRATVPQVRLSGAERASNVDDAFALGRSRRIGNGMSLEGQRILLVDDVLTTGATLRACASVLRDAGAAEVSAIVLASAGEGES